MGKRGKVIRFPGGADSSPAGPPGPSRAPRPPSERELVEVHRCRDQAEALVVKSLFDSEGIPCLCRSQLVHSVHPFTVGDQGEIVVLVAAAEAERARLLLARISPGPSFP